MTFTDRVLRSWGEFPRRTHPSAKPEAIRKRIERASPGPRLERFGRTLTPGWYTWGNQIERNMFTSAVRRL